MRNPPPNLEAPAKPPLVLYRAHVCSTTAAASTADLDEVIVFFEAPRQRRNETLMTLLHNAWQVDVSDLIVMNLASELELLETDAMGPETDGDVRLMETGYSPQEIFYADAKLVQLFVRPATLGRLQAALAVAQQRRLEGRARVAFDVARSASTREWAQAESSAATSTGARQ